MWSYSLPVSLHAPVLPNPSTRPSRIQSLAKLLSVTMFSRDVLFLRTLTTSWPWSDSMISHQPPQLCCHLHTPWSLNINHHRPCFTGRLHRVSCSSRSHNLEAFASGHSLHYSRPPLLCGPVKPPQPLKILGPKCCQNVSCHYFNSWLACQPITCNNLSPFHVSPLSSWS